MKAITRLMVTAKFKFQKGDYVIVTDPVDRRRIIGKIAKAFMGKKGPAYEVYRMNSPEDGSWAVLEKNVKPRF